MSREGGGGRMREAVQLAICCFYGSFGCAFVIGCCCPSIPRFSGRPCDPFRVNVVFGTGTQGGAALALGCRVRRFQRLESRGHMFLAEMCNNAREDRRKCFAHTIILCNSLEGLSSPRIGPRCWLAIRLQWGIMPAWPSHRPCQRCPQRLSCRMPRCLDRRRRSR